MQSKIGPNELRQYMSVDFPLRDVVSVVDVKTLSAEERQSYAYYVYKYKSHERDAKGKLVYVDRQHDVIPDAISILNLDLSQVKHEQLSKTGIDVDAMIDSLILNEIVQSLEKHAVYELFTRAEALHRSDMDLLDRILAKFRKNHVDARYVDSHRLMLKVVREMFVRYWRRTGTKADIVVCNVRLAAVLSDLLGFKVDRVSNPINGPGLVRSIGCIDDPDMGQVKVYVDPFMKWDDPRMILSRSMREKEDGLYLFYDSDTLKVDATTDCDHVDVHINAAVLWVMFDAKTSAPTLTHVHIGKRMMM